MELMNFPSLEPDEFTEVCHFLDRRYRQATLGEVRRQWRLRICESLACTFMSDTGSSTYIQIIRPLEATLDHGNLSVEMEKFSFGDEVPMADKEMMDAEDDDDVRKRENATQTTRQLTMP